MESADPVMLDIFLYHPLQRNVEISHLTFHIPPGWTGVRVRATPGGQPGRVLFTEMPTVDIHHCVFIRKAA